MVKHYNPSISEDAARILNTKGEYLSSDVLPNIQPTIDIKRICNIVRQADQSTTGAFTIFTTPTDKDFYLVGWSMSFSKGSATDATNSLDLTVVIDGVTQAVETLGIFTLNTHAEALSGNCAGFPIKLDRGTNIQMTGTFTAGTLARSARIIGFTVETTKGQ